LVLSGLTEPETRVQAFDSGADDFISKPVHMPELLKRIDAFHRTFKAYSDEHRARARAERLIVYASEANALLAHDLNNGLATAMGNLQFVAEMMTADVDPEVKDAVEASLRALKRMGGLVKNFVDIGRLEDAALAPKRTDVRIHELLETMRGVHESTKAGQARRIEIRCAENLVAHVDPVLVERVLHNLVGNATRYVTDKGHVVLKGEPDGDGVRLEVGNTGPRIPDHVRKTLFEKYGTGGDNNSLRGMGLYFCRLACEAHGGSIGLDDSKELDVNFVARFPGAR
jgi:K+-sensing histidine kinase KdpD